MWSHNNDKGSIVLTILVGFMVVSTVLAGLTTLALTLWQHSVGYGQHSLALETAESGLAHAKAWLKTRPLSTFGSYPYNTKAKAHPTDANGSFFVTYDAAQKTLTSTGQYNKSTRQLGISVHEDIGSGEMEFKQALYASTVNTPGKPAIYLDGSSQIIGDVTINATYVDAVYMAWSTGIDGDLTLGPGADPEKVINGAQPYKNHINGDVHTLTATTTFKMPEYPAFPSDLSQKGNFEAVHLEKPLKHVISSSGQYGDFVIPSDRTVTINLTSGDIHLRIKKLLLTQGHIVLEGNGKLFLYVDELFELSGSSSVNKGGKPDDVFMYYSGSGKFSAPGDTDFVGSVFLQKAALTINGSGGIQGNIISGGPSINIEGGASAIVRVLYAPSADIIITGSSEVRGSIVGNTLKGTGNVRVYYEATDIDMPITIPAPSGGSGGGTGAITYSGWKVK